MDVVQAETVDTLVGMLGAWEEALAADAARLLRFLARDAPARYLGLLRIAFYDTPEMLFARNWPPAAVAVHIFAECWLLDACIM